MTENIKDTIRAMEDRRYAAMIAADAGALNALLGDDLRYTHSNTTVDTKESLMALITSGKLSYQATRPVIDDIFIYGDTALVTGSVELDVKVGQADRTVKGRYTNVWARNGDAWQFVAWQSTPYPAA